MVFAALRASVGPLQGARRVRFLSALTLCVVCLAAQEPEGSVEQPAATLRGRVLDVDGAPIANACVRQGSRPFDDVMAAPDARTDGDGWFGFDADESERSLSVAADGKALARVLTDWRQGVPLDVGDLFLLDGATIRGRVDDADGQPLAGVRVTLRGRGRFSNALPGSAETDADGIFTLRGASPLTAALAFSKSGYADLALPGIVAASPIHVAMERAERIAGRVLDGDGQPVAGALVRVQREDGGSGMRGVVADEVGAFEAFVPRGLRFRVRASARESSDVARTGVLAAPDDEADDEPGEDLELRLPTAATRASLALTVRGLDGEGLDGEGQDGELVKRFRVVPLWEVGPDWNLDLRAMDASLGVDGENGRLVLVPDDTWSPEHGLLLVRGEGYGELVVPATKPEGLGVGQAELEVTLPAERRVTGVVVDGEGLPVAGASIWLQAIADRQGAASGAGVPGDSEVTAADGVFELRGLAARAYAVFAFEPELGIAGAVVDLAEDGVGRLRLELPAAEPFDLHLANGDDLAGWKLMLHPAGGKVELEYGSFELSRSAAYPRTVPLREGGLRGVRLPGGLGDTALVWEGPFGALRLEASRSDDPETGAVTVDLADARLASVRGRVAVAGLPATARGLAISIRSTTGQGGRLEVPVVGGREFAARLRPGSYRLSIIEVATGLALGAGEVVEVAAGDQAASCELTAEVGTLRIVPTAAEGWARHAMSGLRLGTQRGVDALDLTAVTQPFELLVPAGSMEYRVHRWHGALGVDDRSSEEILTGRVEVRAGETVVLVLQEPERRSDAELAAER